jgi:hypothetical protein
VTAPFAAFCDADVLVPIVCCDFLLTASEVGLVDVVNAKDRHVAAAAVEAGADVLVTNDRRLRDEVVASSLVVRPMSADDLGAQLWDSDHEAVSQVIDTLSPSGGVARRRGATSPTSSLDTCQPSQRPGRPAPITDLEPPRSTVAHAQTGHAEVPPGNRRSAVQGRAFRDRCAAAHTGAVGATRGQGRSALHGEGEIEQDLLLEVAPAALLTSRPLPSPAPLRRPTAARAAGPTRGTR